MIYFHEYSSTTSTIVMSKRHVSWMPVGQQTGRMGKKKEKGKGDPKAAALAFLGINLGSKNVRSLKKEEVHAAFIKQLHISESM